MPEMTKAEMYAEQYDHQWIAEFGCCQAEIEESGNRHMMDLYLTGLWGYLLGKGLRVRMMSQVTVDQVQIR